jgi:Gas vesicle synthesis protein GvpL/GvpF
VTATEATPGSRVSGGTYVYGVTWSGRGAARSAGVRDAAVTSVEHGELAALVSEIGADALRAKRRDLLRHSDVLQDAFASAPVLPFRFGTVLATPESVVEDLLAPRYEELVALLHQFDGLSELRLRARFVEDALLAEIVRDDPRIAALRDATRNAPATDARHVELGEAVAGSLAAKRAAAADELVGSLVAHARQVHVDEQAEELEVVRASFLVDERGARPLERAAEALAAANSGRIAMELVGPMPPHSFAALTARGGR